MKNYSLPYHRKKNSLIFSESIAKYIEIIELYSDQTNSRINFILKFLLVNPESYKVYQLYITQSLGNWTYLHHISPNANGYISHNHDILLYSNTKYMNSLIRQNKVTYPIISDAISDAQLLSRMDIFPYTCQKSIIMAKEYNLQRIGYELYLIVVSHPLSVSISYGSRKTVTQIMHKLWLKYSQSPNHK